MTDFQRFQQAATPPACPEKVTGLLTPRHLELIHQARQALHRATNPNATAGERVSARPAWQAAAERLAVALVSRLAAIEETDCD